MSKRNTRGMLLLCLSTLLAGCAQPTAVKVAASAPARPQPSTEMMLVSHTNAPPVVAKTEPQGLQLADSLVQVLGVFTGHH